MAENSPFLPELRDAVRKEAGFLVGAGVSANATNGDPCTHWRGLLQDGIKRCTYVDQRLGRAFIDRWKPIVDAGDLHELLAAGDVVTDKLRGDEFGAWLKTALGKLTIKDSNLISLIANAGLPIATTNYDYLLESQTGWDPVSIGDGSARAALKRPGQAIVHIHGHYLVEKSIVLGAKSYQRHVDDRALVGKQIYLAQERSWIYIGFGAGLGDPNFAALFEWLTETLRNSDLFHFQLVLDADVEAAQKALPEGSHIRVLGYGERHDDLAPFLQSVLRPPGRVGVSGTPGAHHPHENQPPLDEAGVYYACFVGRESLIRLVDSAVRGLIECGGEGASRPAELPRIIWVHGVGGLGKSTFLRRACVEARHLFKGRGEVVLVDWASGSRWLKPLTVTPPTQEALFDPIVARLEQYYGVEVLDRFRAAQRDVQQYHDRRIALRSRFGVAFDVMTRTGMEWNGAATTESRSEVQEALAADSTRQDLTELQFALLELGHWQNDSAALRRGLLQVRDDPSLFARVLEVWTRRICGPAAPDALIAPGRVIADGLRGSLETACRIRPMVLAIDSLERLTSANEAWLRRIVTSLVNAGAALLVLVASECAPDVREPPGPETWRNRIPERWWSTAVFDETMFFKEPEVRRVVEFSLGDAAEAARLAEPLHAATRGVPLALKVLLDDLRRDQNAVAELERAALRGPAWNTPEFARSMIEVVSDRFLEGLKDDRTTANDFRAIIAVTILRAPDTALLGRLSDWPNPSEAYGSLVNRYAVFKGKELHETVRDYLRRCWRERPPSELPEVAAATRALHRDSRPREGSRDDQSWLLEDLNLALWELGDAGLKQFAPRIADALARNSGMGALIQLFEELPYRSTPSYEPLRRIFEANRAAIDTAIHLWPDDVAWLDACVDDTWTITERASLDLIAGIALVDDESANQDTYLRVRRRLESAIRAFKDVPRANQAARAYAKAVIMTSSRIRDDAARDALMILERASLLGELEMRNHAALQLYAGNFRKGAGLWLDSIAGSGSAADYRALGLIYRDYGGPRYYDEAVKAFRRAANAEPERARNWMSLAAIELRRENIALFTRLRKRGERCSDSATDSEALNTLAWAYYVVNYDLEAAERYARAAYENSGRDMHVLHTLVAIEIRRDEWNEGKRDLRTLLESQTAAAPTLYWKSIYETVGEAIGRRGSEVIELLRSLRNVSEWADFTEAAEAVAARRGRSTRMRRSVAQHFEPLRKAAAEVARLASSRTGRSRVPPTRVRKTSV